jgi:hypothetical protein
MYVVSSVASPLELGVFWEYIVALDAEYRGHIRGVFGKWVDLNIVIDVD